MLNLIKRTGSEIAKVVNGEIARTDNSDLIVRRNKSELRLDRKREISIYGQKHNVDPRALMRMIKNITQTIGEYKRSDNPLSHYAIHALRKSRSDVAADLENTFGIQMNIDKETGETIFTL